MAAKPLLTPEAAYEVWSVAWGVAGGALVWRRRASLRAEPDGRTAWRPSGEILIAYFGLYIAVWLMAGLGVTGGLSREIAELAPGVLHFEKSLQVMLHPGLIAGALLLLRRHARSVTPQRPHRVAPKGAFGFTPAGVLLGFSGAMALVLAAGTASWLVLRAVRLAGWGEFEKPQEIVTTLSELNHPAAVVPFLLGAAVFAPVHEELVFRGGVFAALRGGFPRGSAYLLSGAVFGLVHWSVPAFLPLAVLGAWLAWLYDTTADMRVPVTVHALFNLNTIVWALLAPGAIGV